MMISRGGRRRRCPSGARASVRGKPFLRIFGEGISIVYALPRSGSLVIGRGKTADLRIDDASISRQHATLHVGTSLELEDLESANGTWVGHTRLVPRERMAVHPGDVIELGTVMIVIQPGDSASAPRRVLPEPPAWMRPEEEPSLPKGARASVVVQDPAMQQLYRLVERVAASDISVLLLGETGAGKEVMAEAIHSRSPRASKPLLRLNCAALSESLLESELFGHEKGPSPARTRASPACWRRRRAARCSSMRSARCRPRSRPSCCACWRSAW